MICRKRRRGEKLNLLTIVGRKDERTKRLAENKGDWKELLERDWRVVRDINSPRAGIIVLYYTE